MLRDYQEEAINALGNYWMKNKAPCVLQLATGGGKSWIIAEIVKRTGQSVLVLQPSKEILEQNYEKLLAVGVNKKDIEVCSASVGKWNIGKITLATIGTVWKHFEYCKHFKIVIIDECLDGDCEVLTPNGWKKMSTMPNKIAQWENGKLSFVRPLRWVKKKPTGKVVKTTWGGNSGRGAVVYMTKNHRQLVHDMTPWHNFRDKDRVLLAKDLQVRDSLQIYTAQKQQPNLDGEPPYADMLKIAICADGHIEKRKDGRTWVRLSFRRKRKIERAEWLLKKNNLAYKKVVNARGDTSFAFHYDCTKSLSQLDLTLDYSVNRYRALELLEWDGCSKQHRYFADSQENAEIARTIGTLGGFTSRISHYEKRPHIWYVSLSDIDHTTTSNLVKEEVEYDGYVYCPTVPSSFFMVKKGDFIFVTGNCDVCPIDRADSQYVAFLNHIPDARVVGLTATPWRNQTFIKKFEDPRVYCRPLTRIHTREGKGTPHGEWFWKGGIIYKCDIERLQKGGYLSPTVYHIAEADWSFVRDVAGRTDFDTNEMTKFMDIEANTSRFTQAVTWCMKNNLKTIIFSPNIDMNFRLAAVIKALGGKVECMDSENDTKTSREQKMADFRSGKFQFLVNVGMVGRGVDVPSVDAVILCRPTKSLSLYEQEVGRCLRLDPDNPDKIAYILDLSGNVDRFGKVEDIKLSKVRKFKYNYEYYSDAITLLKDGKRKIWDQVS